MAAATRATVNNVAEATPELKDAVVAVIGASVSLGGLLLVFCGFLYAQATAMPPSTSNVTLNKYRTAARYGLFPFGFSLALAAFGLYYWLEPCAAIAHIVMLAFVIETVGTIAYGIWASRLL